VLTSGPRGTNDILPGNVRHWQYFENLVRQMCRRYNYHEIRTPIFEHTELFQRGVGETTDIVEKEMYTFNDRSNRSITLRPEGTAAVVRSFIENKLYAEPQPTKLYYMGPMFRYDRPQAGRYRQFHQFGVEAIGAADPAIDAEVIALAVDVLKELGLTDLHVYINSVGCPACRPSYRETLQDFLQEKVTDLCEDCQSRYNRNPMRILDCKNEQCSRLTEGAPAVSDCLCEECGTHFARVKALLDTVGIEYIVNPRLVRGLDYYTKTAFEVQYPALGAQSAVCGGGRYDGLIEQCGGDPTPGIGFGMGIERVLLALEKQGLVAQAATSVDVFIASMGPAAYNAAFALLSTLRKAGLSAEIDYMGRSLKAQMKFAAKLPARYVAILGDEELAEQAVTLRDMATGQQDKVAFTNLLETINGIREE
jgi:histidyl-tRNA synthetase